MTFCTRVPLKVPNARRCFQALLAMRAVTSILLVRDRHEAGSASVFPHDAAPPPGTKVTMGIVPTTVVPSQ
ncbi:hypothetical protein C8Q78DRAFT_1063076 [Trametes maxima]|nr:hypothetical protein C8Q78DRAFT_1063076 [Trametes maxima]